MPGRWPFFKLQAYLPGISGKNFSVTYLLQGTKDLGFGVTFDYNQPLCTTNSFTSLLHSVVWRCTEFAYSSCTLCPGTGGLTTAAGITVAGTTVAGTTAAGITAAGTTAAGTTSAGTTAAGTTATGMTTAGTTAAGTTEGK